MSEAFTRSGTAPFKAIGQPHELEFAESLGGENTDAYAFPNAVGSDLADSDSWAEIEDALIRSSEPEDVPNMALLSHERATVSQRSMLLARSEQGLMLVDDRPLGTDDDHQMAEELSTDIVDVLRVVGLEDGDLVLISRSLAYLFVVDGLWIHLNVVQCANLGKALSQLESIREAAS